MRTTTYYKSHVMTIAELRRTIKNGTFASTINGIMVEVER